MDDEAAASIEDADQIIERAADVDVADVDVPVLVRPQRLLKALAFCALRAIPAGEAACPLEDAIHGGRAGRDHIRVHHHIGQPAVAFQRVFGVEGENCLLLPGFQPMVAGHEGVVLVDLPVSRSPVVELAHAHTDPLHQPRGGQLRPPTPLTHVIDHLVPHIMRHPAAI